MQIYDVICYNVHSSFNRLEPDPIATQFVINSQILRCYSLINVCADRFCIKSHAPPTKTILMLISALLGQIHGGEFPKDVGSFSQG